MKQLFALALFCIPLFSLAQNSDIEEIKTTLNYYLEGGTNGDFETLKKAFHEDATMKYIRDGYQAVNALEFFGSRMNPGKPSNRTTQILSVDHSGPAAQAKLRIDYPTFAFIDYMNLLKIDGEWKIVSKIFDRVSKE